MPEAYDAAFTWPFPRLPVTVRDVGAGSGGSRLDALVDTGADITLVPSESLQEIGSVEIYTAHLRGHWRQHLAVTIHLVDIEVAGHLLPAVEVAADEWSHRVLLGRNVLNKLVLLLDGPAGYSDVLVQRPARL